MESKNQFPSDDPALEEGRGKTKEAVKAVKVGKEKLSAFVKTGVGIFSEAGETVEAAIKNALRARRNVIMVRVNDESLARLDALVEAGLFKSRSESAAFMISEGVKRQAPLFNAIAEKIAQIQQIRSELRNMANPSEPE